MPLKDHIQITFNKRVIEEWRAETVQQARASSIESKSSLYKHVVLTSSLWHEHRCLCHRWAHPRVQRMQQNSAGTAVAHGNNPLERGAGVCAVQDISSLFSLSCYIKKNNWQECFESNTSESSSAGIRQAVQNKCWKLPRKVTNWKKKKKEKDDTSNHLPRFDSRSGWAVTRIAESFNAGIHFVHCFSII